MCKAKKGFMGEKFPSSKFRKAIANFFGKEYPDVKNFYPDYRAAIDTYSAKIDKIQLPDPPSFNEQLPDPPIIFKAELDAKIYAEQVKQFHESITSKIAPMKNEQKTDPHVPGAKLDEGKNRLGLVLLGFSRALQEVGKVGTFGAGKYTDDGWVNVPDGEARYTDAMLRHLLDEATGEQLDFESGLLHAAHVAWNALARLDLVLRLTKEVRDEQP